VPRAPATESGLLLDDPLGEQGGNLFEHLDRHDKHCENTSPLAHPLVTRHDLRDAVRFPVDARRYRRDEERPQGETGVPPDCPDREMPRHQKARAKLHKEGAPPLLQEPEVARLAATFQTKLTLVSELVEQAMARNLPFQTVLMDRWLLTPELHEVVARSQKDGSRRIKANRNLEGASFTLRDANGPPASIPGPPQG